MSSLAVVPEAKAVDSSLTLAIPREWKKGDECMVHSRSHGGWCRGRVLRKVEAYNDDDDEIEIAFSAGGQDYIKTVPQFSSDVKAIDFEFIAVDCVCGKKMKEITDKRLVYRKPEEEMEGTPSEETATEDEESKKSKGYEELIKAKYTDLKCNLCAVEIQETDTFFHCPVTESEIHVAGFDMCKACASRITHAEVLDLAIPESEAAESGGTLASQVGDKPFAEGGMRYAFLAQLKIPSMMGRLCVVKKLKDCHPYSDEEWKADMECIKVAKEMVDAYNEEVKPTKPLKINIPVIGRKGSGMAEHHKMLGAMLPLLLSSEGEGGIGGDLGGALALLALMSIMEIGNDKKSSEEDTKEQAEDEVVQGECVVVEHFLRGDFVKWNSNSGWMKDDSLSIQAFCHWTYHWSKGKMLYVDAQGIRRPDCYILTDPCILSDTNEGMKYGLTDLGINAILGWFKQHKCDRNRFCKTDEWLKPTEEQYANWVPLEPVKATTCVRVQRRATLTDADMKAKEAAKATRAFKPKLRGETAARAKAVEERRAKGREQLKKKEEERKRSSSLSKKKDCLVM